MKTRIAKAMGLDGSLLESVRLAGRVVDVIVELNDSELARRRQTGRNVAVDRDALRLLAELPHRQPVPLSDFDPFRRTLLQTMGEGLARVTESHVERTWMPPLEIRGFLVVSANWRTALRRVSLFTADAPRAIAYTGSGSLANAQARAKTFGVGLARVLGKEIEVLVQPERHLVRHDEIRWALTERLLSLWSARAVKA